MTRALENTTRDVRFALLMCTHRGDGEKGRWAGTLHGDQHLIPCGVPNLRGKLHELSGGRKPWQRGHLDRDAARRLFQGGWPELAVATPGGECGGASHCQRAPGKKLTPAQAVITGHDLAR